MNAMDNDFLFDEESEDAVRRYEQSVNDRRMPYFDVEELEAIADYYLSYGQTKESSKVIELGLKLHPNNTALQRKRAKVYLLSGEAQKAYQIVERNFPLDDAESLMLKGEALMQLHRTKEASLIFQHLIRLPDIDIESTYLDIAYIYIASGDYSSALSYLEQGVAIDNKSLDLLQETAICCEQLQKIEKAIDYYQRMISIDPYFTEAWYNLGLVYFGQAAYEKALDAFDFVTIIDDKDAGGWLQKGNTFFHLNQYNEALTCYSQCEKLTVYEGILYVFMGECLEKMEKYDEAKIYYNKSLEINNQDVEGWIGLGICALETEDYETAATHFQKALDIEPNNSEALVYLAETQINTNKSEEALMSYRKSLVLEPNQPETWLSMGNVYVDLGLYEQAVVTYQRALSQDDSLENIYLFLAIAEYKSGHISSAMEFLDKARESNPEANMLFLELCPEATSLLEDHQK
ncbi:tetratricopeptide repeat protein [Microbacter margulisiae]|uniref:Tetratricopeptide (TPR) repeat protein n=1 Tax=Microbacter margulisiae TaxID=1350067 RepID=A0A7W5DNT3_9PORP|nr:tetratricopeptide repeat protein [Microbacter margulisiae]MBB3185859.1 tetratricopeptide (TPR) repeat protein [Microbacter margulisiae]